MKSQKEYKKAILELLGQRAPGKTICPSEILALNEKQDKEKMEAVMKAASELAEKGISFFTQKGEVIDPENFKGPIRLRLSN